MPAGSAVLNIISSKEERKGKKAQSWLLFSHFSISQFHPKQGQTANPEHPLLTVIAEVL